LVGRFQPDTVVWRPRSKVNWSGGASLEIVEPAPMTAPAPTSTGATSSTPEPMKALSPMIVRNLLAPS
jgi:hypothetical protein